MAQHDYTIDDQNGLAFLADLNESLAAIVSNNSGTAEPATTFAYQWWADTAAGILKRRNAANSSWINVMSLNGGLIIGTDVQPYDADTAKLDVSQAWTASQRSGNITDNDASFDLSGAGNNYTCTPTAAFEIAFTNIAANVDKSGYLTIVNSANYVATAHANTKIAPTDLTTLSGTGTYKAPYHCDGTNVNIMGVWKQP